ncbi:hypothetical protein JCM10212_001614 [Sporobolomyces blumeae]
MSSLIIRTPSSSSASSTAVSPTSTCPSTPSLSASRPLSLSLSPPRSLLPSIDRVARAQEDVERQKFKLARIEAQFERDFARWSKVDERVSKLKEDANELFKGLDGDVQLLQDELYDCYDPDSDPASYFLMEALAVRKKLDELFAERAMNWCVGKLVKDRPEVSSGGPLFDDRSWVTRPTLALDSFLLAMERVATAQGFAVPTWQSFLVDYMRRDTRAKELLKESVVGADHHREEARLDQASDEVEQARKRLAELERWFEWTLSDLLVERELVASDVAEIKRRVKKT